VVNRTDGDRRLRDLVAHAVPTRFTDRIRLEPITGPNGLLPGHVADLVSLHADPWVAQWNAGVWSADETTRRAVDIRTGWERDSVSKWIAYERTGGSVAGRGGLSRMTAGAPATVAVAELAGPAWAVDRLELGWALAASVRARGTASEIGRAGLRVRDAGGSGRRRLHRAAQHRLARGDGTARDDLRGRDHHRGSALAPSGSSTEGRLRLYIDYRQPTSHTRSTRPPRPTRGPVGHEGLRCVTAQARRSHNGVGHLRGRLLVRCQEPPVSYRPGHSAPPGPRCRPGGGWNGWAAAIQGQPPSPAGSVGGAVRS